jgi:hypothetical protein
MVKLEAVSQASVLRQAYKVPKTSVNRIIPQGGGRIMGLPYCIHRAHFLPIAERLFP